MRIILTSLTLFFLFLSFPAAAQEAYSYESFNIPHDGLRREYYVYDPRANKSLTGVYGGLRPMIIVLHGGGGRADKFDLMTGTSESFDTLANREDLLIVYPQGYKKQWNDGREAQSIEAQKLNINDSGFVSDIIDRMIKTRAVDPARIYATGPSNGGHMSNRLACDLSDKIAAVAIVIANMPAKLVNKCKPAHAMSVLIMNGSADPLVPYDGGTVEVLGSERGEDLSTDATFGFWLKQAGFQGRTKDIKPLMMPDTDRNDGTRVIKQGYKGNPGAEVILYTVQGGGHTWPGGRQYLFKAAVGRVSRDISATQTIWQFFKRNPKH